MPPVLIVSGEALGPSAAGPALRVAGLAAALARRGHDVVVAAPSPSQAPAGCALAPLEALAELAPRCACALVSGFALERHPELRGAPALCADLAGPFLIENLWVHRSLPATRRRRVLVEEAGVVGRLLERADLVLCASDRQRDLLLGMLLGRGALRPELLDADPALRALVAVLPFGTPDGEPPERAARRDGGPLRLLWPGGLWDWLDAVTAVEAVAEARRRGSDVELELWGARSPDPSVPPMALAQAVTRRVAALGLDGAVRVEPWVPYAERLSRLAAADVAVTLDGGGLEARFAFRTRLLDALWAGVPTLATAGEQVADEAAAAGAGWVVPPGDTGAVAARLAGLAADRGQLAAASARTGEVAGRYRYDVLVEPLHGFCLDPLPRRPGTARPTARQHAGRLAGRVRRAVRERRL